MTRIIAHITLECATALKVGSNNLDALQDSPIQRDWNGLPMILGTSLAGILRKKFSDKKGEEEIFGSEAKETSNQDSKDESKGSKIFFSNALLIDENNQVTENLLLEKSPFLQHFLALPIREHTAITHKGVADKHSKFNAEVVYKGARFKFRMEMLIENDADENTFFEILDFLKDETLRIGSGGTKGRGKIKVLKIEYGKFDENSEDYDNLSSSLNENYCALPEYSAFFHYKLCLIPEDFFIFGSGGGDEDADHIGVTESIIDYENKKLTEQKILIPASSIKGALSQRTSFYYNQLKGEFIENNQDLPQQRVVEIFGSEKDEKKESSKGKLILSDIYCKKVKLENQKVFTHVKIDDFTGGGIDGALFQEKTDTLEESFVLEIWLKNDVEKTALKAFELALKDLAKGALALGGGSNKGHGFFQGTITKIWRKELC